jgi:hypothetical protein
MSATYDYDRAIAICLRVIVKYGGVAILRRQGLADRRCYAGVADMTPAERRDRLIAPTDRLILVSVKDPDGADLNPAPYHEKDSIITLHPKTLVELETLRIVAPVVPFSPGFLPVYYECLVRNARHVS